MEREDWLPGAGKREINIWNFSCTKRKVARDLLYIAIDNYGLSKTLKGLHLCCVTFSKCFKELYSNNRSNTRIFHEVSIKSYLDKNQVNKCMSVQKAKAKDFLILKICIVNIHALGSGWVDAMLLVTDSCLF